MAQQAIDYYWRCPFCGGDEESHGPYSPDGRIGACTIPYGNPIPPYTPFKRDVEGESNG